MTGINLLIKQIEKLENSLQDDTSAAGRILFFDESSYPGPNEAEQALQEIQENEDEPYSFVVSFRCQNREGLVYQDMIIPHSPLPLISIVQRAQCCTRPHKTTQGLIQLESI